MSRLTENSEWKQYQHCLLSIVEPHLRNQVGAPTAWQLLREGLFLARWTEDFDCGEETEWYYCIKDDSFDLMQLKKKRRWEVRQGLKNFVVRDINPCDYVREIHNVQVAAFAEYPEQYRPRGLTLESARREIDMWHKTGRRVQAAFDETECFCGYTVVAVGKRCVEFLVLKVLPKCERLYIDTALVYSLCEKYLYDGSKYYLCDGARNIKHQTEFQVWLVRHFGFRYAYCRLHVLYNPLFRIIVMLLYPWRDILNKLENKSAFLYNVSCILKQEEICRSFGGLKK